MRHRIRKSNLRNRADRDLAEIAREFNPVLQGWINYYGRFNRSALYPFLRYFNHTLRAWIPKYRKRVLTGGSPWSCHAVWLYHRFGLSFRDVEDLLAQRGITVTYETVRQWCQRFGPVYARRLRCRRGRVHGR